MMKKIFNIDSYSEFVLEADIHIIRKILDWKCWKDFLLQHEKMNSVSKIFGFKPSLILNWLNSVSFKPESCIIRNYENYTWDYFLIITLFLNCY